MYREYRNSDGLHIVLPENVFQDICKQVDKFYPNECGGIFVGKITDDSTATIEKMILPKKFRSTPVYFVRLTGFINKWLKDIFKKHNGDVIYLGEWHSHPNGSSHPSGTDIKAMKEIASNPDIRIQTPILLIVGFNKKDYQERFFIYKNNQLISYEQQN
ncbi:desampylase [Flavobacteriales bacterium]|nr:desampylase [Flavobacteriales bacterium]